MCASLNHENIVITKSDILGADDFRKEQQIAVLVIMFSDIVSSTELLETRGEREYARIRCIHDELTHAIVERKAAGRLVKRLGDGFMAVFSEPSMAVERSLEIQENVPKRCQISVRIGLDMGQVSLEKTGGIAMDVFGRFVNRAARINAVAKEGQTLTSYHVWDSAIGWLPPERVRWAEVGEFAFKGFTHPVRCFKFESVTASASVNSQACANDTQLPMKSVTGKRKPILWFDESPEKRIFVRSRIERPIIPVFNSEQAFLLATDGSCDTVIMIADTPVEAIRCIMLLGMIRKFEKQIPIMVFCGLRAEYRLTDHLVKFTNVRYTTSVEDLITFTC